MAEPSHCFSSTPAVSPPAIFLDVFETEADRDLAGFLPSDLVPFARLRLAETVFKQLVT